MRSMEDSGELVHRGTGSWIIQESLVLRGIVKVSAMAVRTRDFIIRGDLECLALDFSGDIEVNITQ